jgi:hypothetical protein
MMTDATPLGSQEDAPNEKTMAAMLEARSGNMRLFDSVGDLMEELNTDDLAPTPAA